VTVIYLGTLLPLIIFSIVSIWYTFDARALVLEENYEEKKGEEMCSTTENLCDFGRKSKTAGMARYACLHR
jgi:hypothetical protein